MDPLDLVNASVVVVALLLAGVVILLAISRPGRR